MSRKRRTFSAQFKANVALEAVKNLKSISELAKQYQVHPNQITLWKKQLTEQAAEVFEGGEKKSLKGEKPETKELYEQIGRLKVQVEFTTLLLKSENSSRTLWLRSVCGSSQIIVS